MVGTYRIAGLNIEIQSVHERVQEYCEEYRTTGAADLVIKSTQEEIDYQRQRCKRHEEEFTRPVDEMSDAYMELMRVNLLIAERMPALGRFLIHGSAIAVDDECYIFSALSGTGKSTHVALWRELLGDRAVTVNDDKPIISVGQDGTATVYGTPWCGKHRRGNNIAVPLRAICLLERSDENRIREMPKSEAVSQLYLHVYRPSAPKALLETMALVSRMNARYYTLGCNMDISAAELAYNTMKG